MNRTGTVNIAHSVPTRPKAGHGFPGGVPAMEDDVTTYLWRLEDIVIALGTLCLTCFIGLELALMCKRDVLLLRLDEVLR